MSENFNAMLYRPIADGKEFNNLIPKPTEAKKTLVGDGDTSFSIKKMVDTVLKYNSQLEKVAKKLQSSSLTDSIDNVKLKNIVKELYVEALNAEQA